MRHLFILCYCTFGVSAKGAAADPLITVSKETTFVTEPVNDKDGFVDLVTAINAKYSEGIKTETNAAALIYPALGPEPDGTAMSQRFFKELGVPYPAPDGDYFQSLFSYLKETELSIQIKEMYRVQDEQGEAMSAPWKREDYPEIADWIDAQAVPMKLIEKGIARDQFYCPVNLDVEKGTSGQLLVMTLLPHIQAQRAISRLLICRAMLNAGEGNNEAAWKDLLTSYRFGRHASRGVTLISRLVGLAIEAISYQAMLDFVGSTRPDKAACEKYFADLKTLPTKAPMFECIDFGERLVFVDLVATLAFHQGDEKIDAVVEYFPVLGDFFKKGSNIIADWDVVLKEGNARYDRVVAAMKMETYSEQLAAFTEIDRELLKLGETQNFWSETFFYLALAAKDKRAVTAYLSNKLIGLMLPGVEGVSVAELRSKQYFNNLQIAIALAAYHSEHNAYPNTLQELVPDFLKVLPNDLFNQEPMKYTKTDTGFLLYSVGANQIDDEGKSFKEQKDDLVVQVPPPKGEK